jgi:hypothetical protein
MARLHADEDFDHGVVAALRRLGHDVLTVQEAGQGNQSTPDAEVLAFATRQGRAVLTFNRLHFKRLHSHTGTHAGVVSCTRDPDGESLAARIHEAIAAAGDLTGQLIRIYRPSS